jgi:Sulfotransferase domain
MTNIAMWSGPRNISTAMMYAFGNRSDCIAWDEPFYGAYLKTTGLAHPMRDEIQNRMECDWHKVEATCIARVSKPLFYQKHMTHHMVPEFDRRFIVELNNAFLIRSPEKVLASYAKKHDEVSLHAIGFAEQAEIFDQVANHLGHAPPVIDADKHLSDPRKSLLLLCNALNIPFQDAMLKWPKGPKPFDGTWAPHWYNAAWASTQFEPPPERPVELSTAFQRIADQARPYYEKLKAHAL